MGVWSVAVDLSLGNNSGGGEGGIIPLGGDGGYPTPARISQGAATQSTSFSERVATVKKSALRRGTGPAKKELWAFRLPRVARGRNGGEAECITHCIAAGKATAAPPVGSALGQSGLNIVWFCKEYNARIEAQASEQWASVPSRALCRAVWP